MAQDGLTRISRRSRSSKTSLSCWLTRKRNGTSTSKLLGGLRRTSRTTASGWRQRFRPRRCAGRSRWHGAWSPCSTTSSGRWPAAGLDPEGDSEDPLAHGVLLVFRNLRETLGRSGVEVVDPKGEKFDPNFAEALSTVQVEGTEAGVVVEVMQKGYRFEGQLIRPAMVVVAA